MKKLLFYLAAFQGLTGTALAGLKLDHSAQVGFEYDSNVYKTFVNAQSDMLTRILFQSRGDYVSTNSFFAGWDFQGGGKKFFVDGAQDQIIQSIAIPVGYAFESTKIQVILEPSFKYQNESDKIDASGSDLDEDFYSARAQLRIFAGLPLDFSLQPKAAFTYFHFFPDPSISFFREEGGVIVEKKVDAFSMGIDFNFEKTQFDESVREDSLYEVGPYFQYTRRPFISIGYAYQVNNSNRPSFSFNNHRINLLASFLFGSIANRQPDQPLARFSLHFIGIMQFKTFSSVSAVNPEGERFLVTSEEEENFNNFVVKFNYHFHRKWAAETKYTRIANGLSNQAGNFGRSLFYAGVRYNF